MNAALAAPLVYQGDPQVAVDTATRQGGGALEPISLQELRAREAVLLAGGQTSGCPKEASPRPIEEALSSAEGALLYGRFEEAMSAVLQARHAVLCSGQPVSRPQLARIELVTGLIAQEQGNETTARSRYLAALGYDAQIPWPSSYPAERRTLFDTARTELPALTTTLSVRPLQPPALFDGDPLPDTVPVGEHVVHVGPIAVHVTLDEAPNRLVVPQAFPDDALSWAGDDRRAELSALLAATLGEGTDTWIVHEDNVWHGIAGRTDWQAFLAPVAPVVPDPVPDPVPTPRRRWGMTLVGGALALTGGALGTAGTLWTNSQVRKAENTWEERYDELQRNYRIGLVATGVSWGLAGVGVGVGGIGFATGGAR